MATYYIKKYGVHELHGADCVWLPIRKGMVKLGDFATAEEAFTKATTLYRKVERCPTCCNNVGKSRTASTGKS